ncbi:MAG: phosphate ABC transporter permease PstA [Actinomycetota bacterium]
MQAISARRRVKDRMMLGLMGLAIVVAIVPLGSILVEVIAKGVGAIHSFSFFTQPAPGNPLATGGGVYNGIIGTLEMVAVGGAIFIPLGILAGVYLVEFGAGSRLARAVRFFAEVMTGVPSIIFGIFIYSILVVRAGHFTALAGSLALGIIMWPIVIRTSEEMLSRVPVNVREASIALGIPKWKTVLRVVLPTAAGGLVTGCMLGVARAAGETAPLLFTALGNQFTSYSLNSPISSLSLIIYNGALSAYAAQIQRAWGAALTLIAIVLILTLAARFLTSHRSVV